MTDNIISSRLEFKDFTSEEEAKANPYVNALDLPVDKKSVFLVAGKNSRLGNFRIAAAMLLAKGYKIYAYPSVCKKIIGARPVTGKSDEYYRAAATARIIYAVDYLPSFMLVRNGQYVFNDIKKSPKSIGDILSKNQTEMKTSYHVPPAERISISYASKLAGAISHPETVAESHDNDKRKILVAANVSKNENAFELFKRVAYANRDAEVTLVFDAKEASEYENELMKLGDNVRVLPKQGLLPRKQQDNDKILYLGKEYQYLYNPNDIDTFLPSYIFDCERRRTLGGEHFDVAINLLNNSFYWSWLLRTSCDEYVYVDGLGSLRLSDVNREAHNKMISHLEKVYFLREDMYSNAVEDCEGMPHNFGILPYYPGEQDRTEVKVVTVGGKKRLLLDSRNRGIFGAKVVSTAPYFEDGQADYAVINYTLTAEENVDFINELPKDRLMFIIDPYGLINGNTMFVPDGKLVHIPSLKKFSVLLSHFGKCYVIGDNPAVEEEAKLAGKEIVKLTK